MYSWSPPLLYAGMNVSIARCLEGRESLQWRHCYLILHEPLDYKCTDGYKSIRFWTRSWTFLVPLFVRVFEILDYFLFHSWTFHLFRRFAHSSLPDVAIVNVMSLVMWWREYLQQCTLQYEININNKFMYLMSKNFKSVFHNICKLVE
jgi:hypothetical protein